MEKHSVETENNLVKHTEESEKPASPTTKGSRQKAVIANSCLLVWAILLALIGMQAVSGKASTVILDIAEAFVPEKRSNSSGNPNLTPVQRDANSALGLDGSAVMSEYIENQYPGADETAIPPIAIVLDRLQVSVNWRDADEINQANGGSAGAPTRSDYHNLFDIVANRLEAIADFSPEISVSSNLKLSNNVMPSKFRSSKFQEQEIDLPLEAVLWVKTRQAAIAARKSQISFLDLFVLLIILGGFGSWIYLVRKHINPSVEVDLQEYFYRPPLGMTLAIAVFIVNITLHSFVSTSNINEVRRETLILLAFAAGLLSDKTYEFIEKVTGEKLGAKKPDEALQSNGKST